MPRTSFRRKTIKPIPPLDRIARGQGGERAFQDWLDRSHAAYLYLDQTPLTIPLALRSEIKRPDFLLAVDGLGSVAVDVKAKVFLDGCFVIDEYERRTLGSFEARFSIPVWFACFSPHDPAQAWLFRNGALMGSAVGYNPNRKTIHAPMSLGYPCKHYVMPIETALRIANKAA